MVPPRRVVRRRRWLAPAAVVVLLGGGVGIALAVGGGSKKRTIAQAPISTAGPPTTAASASTAPPAPAVSPVRATFDPAQKATFYTVSASGQGSPSFAWRLTPPPADPTCDHFSVVAGKPNEAVWHHADTDGCNHNAMGPAGHLGTVTVTVKTVAWECTATFFGTNTSQGPPARRCKQL